MRIGIATDHGGFDLKEELVKSSRKPDTRSSISEHIGLVRAMTIRTTSCRLRMR
jgi:hypothetical protein